MHGGADIVQRQFNLPEAAGIVRCAGHAVYNPIPYFKKCRSLFPASDSAADIMCGICVAHPGTGSFSPACRRHLLFAIRFEAICKTPAPPFRPHFSITLSLCHCRFSTAVAAAERNYFSGACAHWFFYKGLFTNAFTGDGSWHIFKENLSCLLGYLSATFYFEPTNPFSETLILLIGNAGLIFTLTGFLIVVRKRLTVDDIFFVLVCLMIIFLHQARSQRYILPVMPIVFYYCYATMRVLLPAITSLNGRVAAVAITLFYISLDCDYLKTTTGSMTDSCIPRAKDYAAFAYISHNVSDSDIIVFEKPRALTLYTNKRTVNTAPLESQATNKKFFDSLHVKYALICDDVGSPFLRKYFEEIQRPIDTSYIAPGYTLYRLR